MKLVLFDLFMQVVTLSFRDFSLIRLDGSDAILVLGVTRLRLKFYPVENRAVA